MLTITLKLSLQRYQSHPKFPFPSRLRPSSFIRIASDSKSFAPVTSSASQQPAFSQSAVPCPQLPKTQVVTFWDRDSQSTSYLLFETTLTPWNTLKQAKIWGGGLETCKLWPPTTPPRSPQALHLWLPHWAEHYTQWKNKILRTTQARQTPEWWQPNSHTTPHVSGTVQSLHQ